MRITRSLVPLALAAALLVVAPAATWAQPVRDRVAGAAPGADCTQLGPIVPGRPRAFHRVLCDPGAGATQDVGSPGPVPGTAVPLRRASTDGFPWPDAAIALAAAALALSAVALVAGRQRRSQRRRVAV